MRTEPKEQTAWRKASLGCLSSTLWLCPCRPVCSLPHSQEEPSRQAWDGDLRPSRASWGSQCLSRLWSPHW